MVTWNTLGGDVTVEEIHSFLKDIEGTKAGVLHPMVYKHFEGSLSETKLPFPRCDEHYDRYLYGQLFVPSLDSSHNVKFMELTFVVTLDHTWTIFRHEGQYDESAKHYVDLIEKASDGIEQFANSGEFIGRLLTSTVSELELFLSGVDERVDGLVDELTEISKSKKLSLLLKNDVPGLLVRSNEVRQAIEETVSVIDEMAVMLKAIIDNRIDLVDISGGEPRELFDRNTEIYLADAFYRARRLGSLVDVLQRKLDLIGETAADLGNADEVTSGRFIGAIASILLLPTLIAGLYGMNFEFMPELEWAPAYYVVLGAMVASTVLQIKFFRGKGWL